MNHTSPLRLFPFVKYCTEHGAKHVALNVFQKTREFETVREEMHLYISFDFVSELWF